MRRTNLTAVVADSSAAQVNEPIRFSMSALGINQNCQKAALGGNALFTLACNFYPVPILSVKGYRRDME